MRPTIGICSQNLGPTCNCLGQPYNFRAAGFWWCGAIGSVGSVFFFASLSGPPGAFKRPQHAPRPIVLIWCFRTGMAGDRSSPFRWRCSARAAGAGRARSPTSSSSRCATRCHRPIAFAPAPRLRPSAAAAPALRCPPTTPPPPPLPARACAFTTARAAPPVPRAAVADTHRAPDLPGHLSGPAQGV